VAGLWGVGQHTHGSGREEAPRRTSRHLGLRPEDAALRSWSLSGGIPTARWLPRQAGKELGLERKHEESREEHQLPGRDEPGLEGVAYEVRSPPRPELVTEAVEVRLHGLDAHRQPVGDFLVGQSPGEPAEHLALTLAQQLAGRATSAGRR